MTNSSLITAEGLPHSRDCFTAEGVQQAWDRYKDSKDLTESNPTEAKAVEAECRYKDELTIAIGLRTLALVIGGTEENAADRAYVMQTLLSQQQAESHSQTRFNIASFFKHALLHPNKSPIAFENVYVIADKMPKLMQVVEHQGDKGSKEYQLHLRDDVLILDNHLDEGRVQGFFRALMSGLCMRYLQERDGSIDFNRDEHKFMLVSILNLFYPDGYR